MLVQPGWRVLQSKCPCSSLQTRSAATTKISTRKTKTTDNQILPKAVEYLLTPLRKPWRTFQSMSSGFNTFLLSCEYLGRQKKKENIKAKLCNHPEKICSQQWVFQIGVPISDQTFARQLWNLKLSHFSQHVFTYVQNLTLLKKYAINN